MPPGVHPNTRFVVTTKPDGHPTTYVRQVISLGPVTLHWTGNTVRSVRHVDISADDVAYRQWVYVNVTNIGEYRPSGAYFVLNLTQIAALRLQFGWQPVFILRSMLKNA